MKRQTIISELAESDAELQAGLKYSDSVMTADTIELIYLIESGSYRPSPGTAGELLIDVHPNKKVRFFAETALSEFARSAYLAEGIWWPMILESNPDTATDDESTYVAVCWRQWIDGAFPFRKDRHGVS